MKKNFFALVESLKYPLCEFTSRIFMGIVAWIFCIKWKNAVYSSIFYIRCLSFGRNFSRFILFQFIFFECLFSLCVIAMGLPVIYLHCSVGATYSSISMTMIKKAVYRRRKMLFLAWYLQTSTFSFILINNLWPQSFTKLVKIHALWTTHSIC